MRYLLLTITTVFYLSKVFAQETIEKRNKLTDSVSEKFHVLKSDINIKHGLYQALFRKKIAIANGIYDNNKKTGTWHFYDTQGILVENFDYTKNKLLYEADEDSKSDLRYYVDKILTEADVTTKPIRPGGRYYGYMPYLSKFKLPDYLQDINRNVSFAVLELLVSPLGRLALAKVTIYSGNYQKAFNMNLDVLSDDDKIFIPATVNNEAVSCRILVKCYITSNGIDLF